MNARGQHARAPIGARAFRLAPALAVALTACTVGPEYAPPKLEVADAWHRQIVAEMGEAADGSGGLARWWTAFRDPVLDDLIAKADAGNQDLAASLWRIEGARASRRVTRGEWFPDIDARGGYERYRDSANGPLAPAATAAPGAPAAAPPPGVENRNLTSVGLDATWEIDVFGRIRRAVEAADADLDAAVEDHRDLRVVLFAEVAAAYLETRTLQSRLAIAERNAKSQSETLELTKRRFESELAPGLDVAQAETNLAATRSEIPAIARSLDAALYRLAVLLGEAPGAVHLMLSIDVTRSSDEAGDEAEPAPIPVARPAAVPLPADLLRRRPDVRAAERRLAAEVARIGVAEADLYPRFSLSGSYGYESLDGSNTLDSSSRTYSFGPSFRWNLLDFGRVRGNIAVAEANAEQAALGWEAAVLRAQQEVETALSAYGNEQERRERLHEGAESAERAVGHARTLYGEGLTDFQNVLDAERTLFVAQDRRAASEGQVAQYLIDLYRALGGGWSEDEAIVVPAPRESWAAARTGS